MCGCLILVSVQIDGTRIALWGTSYSGGHSIYAAATASTAVKPNIKGVIALVRPLVKSLVKRLINYHRSYWTSGQPQHGIRGQNKAE
jgi:hypothetical protein